MDVRVRMGRARRDLPVGILHAGHLRPSAGGRRLRSDAGTTAEVEMDLQLKGKTALVFGGSKGIGRGIADALAAEGVAVAIVARTKETIDRAVSEMTARGGRAIGLTADLANWPSV